ncbi:hypothetical protein MMC17_005249 [Xylographa soralifera]|nr:hypothetical protein [Xylographa soralifera]
MVSKYSEGVLPTPLLSRPLSLGSHIHGLPPFEQHAGLVSTTTIDSHEMVVQENLLVVSPYTAPLHLLDLRTISKPNQLLAKALTLFKQVRRDYATAPYTESFNWAHIIEVLRAMVDKECAYSWEQQDFYIIVFRSQLPLATDRTHLAELDKLSHAGATESGGLLKYWFGVPDIDGRNLATCIWRSRDDARKGGSGVDHVRAMRETIKLYTEWNVERLNLTIGEGVRHWKIIELTP